MYRYALLLIVSLLFVASAAVTNGDFQRIADGWFPSWTRGDPALITAQQDGDHSFVRFTLPDHAAAMIEQRVVLPPTWREITLSLRARVTGLVPGAGEPWQTARLQFVFRTAEGEHVGGWPDLRMQPEVDGWQDLTTTHVVPEGAHDVTLTLGSWGAKGVIDIDDVTLIAARVAQKPPGQNADPVVFALQPVVLSPDRQTMTLSGEWRFQPAVGASGRQPIDDAWGLIRVPGSWHDAVTHRGGGDAWHAFQPQETHKAWYACEVDIPATWQAHAVDLCFDRVSTDAQVWVNEQEVGHVLWPWGEFDITSALRPGRNRILVGVVALNDRSEVKQYMGYVDEPTVAAKLDSRGIIGAVTLRSRPRGGHLADLNIRPSVRLQALDLDLELRAAVPGALAIHAEMIDQAGNVERTFTQTIAVTAVGDQTVTVRFPWADPRLWDVGRPELYTLALRLDGAGIRDSWRQDFGFREFWIDGREFYLNGSLIRLRPRTIEKPADVAEMLQRDWNLGHHWPKDQIRRGVISTYDRETLAEADRRGLLCDANVAHMQWTVQHWTKPEVREEYQRIIAQQVRWYRQHPSVVMYTTTANAFGWHGDSDPWTIGRTEVSATQERHRDRARMLELSAAVKAIDPKPVFAHHGSDMGDVFTSNMYLNFLPMQEREEWISAWAVSGELPFMPVEFGMPLYTNVMRGRNGYSDQGHSEPFPSEWSAAHLGPAAYAQETGSIRSLVTERFKPGNPHKEYEPHIRWDRKEQVLLHETALWDTLTPYILNTWRSWRALGISGGMIAWAHDDHPALAEVNRATLGFIAGPGGIPDQSGRDDQPITDKTHHYRPGDELRKQVVLINDGRQEVPFSGTLTVRLGSTVLQEQRLAGTLAISERQLLPVAQRLPAGVTGDGTIDLRITIGGQDHAHAFAFRVIAPPKAPALTVAVFDPVGDTAAWLTRLGITATAWTAGTPTEAVAVVGRHVLDRGHQVPVPLADWVAAGGRLLVMGQDPRFIQHALHLRTAPTVTRRVFPMPHPSPALAAIDAEALRDWNGAGTLVQAYPASPAIEMVPSYGWRWGNRHSVCSAPIEVPHRGAWRPLFQGEFDLAYTPALELDHGRGRVTLCTFDFEVRTAQDPQADQFAIALLDHVARAAITPRVATVYMGGETGAALLRDLGVIYTEAKRVPGNDHLLIIGADAVVDDAALRRFLSAGGTAIALRREHVTGPLGLRLESRTDFAGSLAIPGWSEAAGMASGDLRWRGTHTAWLVPPQDGVEVAGDGQLARMSVGRGRLILAQLGPNAVPADTKRFFRFTRWRQTRALAQVLTNGGASFAQDARFLALLHEPDFYLPLAGEDWLAQNTTRLAESPDRVWHAPQPISERAKTLVQVDADVSGMQQVQVPSYLEAYGPEWRWIDGETVFRRTFTWPAYAAGKPVFVDLGRVDEHETTFFNGTHIGSSKHWLFPRGHEVQAGLVRSGANVLAVRHWDEGIHGGMCGSPEHLGIGVLGTDPGFYHPDYVADGIVRGGDEAAWAAGRERWKVADNPYRYYRW